jgi:hypothetical protein
MNDALRVGGIQGIGNLIGQLQELVYLHPLTSYVMF